MRGYKFVRPINSIKLIMARYCWYFKEKIRRNTVRNPNEQFENHICLHFAPDSLHISLWIIISSGLQYNSIIYYHLQTSTKHKIKLLREKERLLLSCSFFYHWGFITNYKVQHMCSHQQGFIFYLPHVRCTVFMQILRKIKWYFALKWR